MPVCPRMADEYPKSLIGHGHILTPPEVNKGVQAPKDVIYCLLL